MAVDRLLLRCPCGAPFYFATHMDSPWNARIDIDILNNWLEEHATCDGYPSMPTLDHENADGFIGRNESYLEKLTYEELQLHNKGRSPVGTVLPD